MKSKDSDDRSPGLLWNIDPGWIIIAFAKNLRSSIEKKLSSFSGPPHPVVSTSFVPSDSSLSLSSSRKSSSSLFLLQFALPLLLPIVLSNPPFQSEMMFGVLLLFVVAPERMLVK